MPDVGVLNLEITSNASKAAGALQTLGTKLERINTIVANATQLGNFSTNLANIANAVNSFASSPSVKKITALGNAMKALTEASQMKKMNFPTAGLEKLKDVLGNDGIKIGQAGYQMRALVSAMKEFSGTESASSSMTTFAKKVEEFKTKGTSETLKDIASAMREYVEASKKMKEIGEDFKEVNSTIQTASETAKKVKWTEPTRDENGKVKGPLPLNLQFNAAKGQKQAPGQISMELDKLSESVQNASDKWSSAMSEIQSSTETALGTANDKIKETGGLIPLFNPETGENGVGISEQMQEASASAKESLSEVESKIEHMGSVSENVAGKIEGSLSGAFEDVRERIEERNQLFAEADQKRLEDNYANFRELYMSGEGEWQKQVPEMYGLTGESIEQCETYAEALKMTMAEVNQYVDHFIESMNTPTGPLLRDAIDQSLGIGNAFKDAADSANILQNAPEIVESFNSASAASENFGNAAKNTGNKAVILGENLKDLDKELKQKKTDMNEAGNGAKSLARKFSDLMLGSNGAKGALKKMFPALSGLVKRFGQIAKYRMLRAILKQITEGFREGVENVYHYSKAVGTDFAPTMDSAASSLLQMKNSIGAAAAPLIQALVPALQTVVSWVITAMNYVNQFLSLLTGQSEWTQAIPATAEAFEDTAKSAGAAGKKIKEAKNLLAGWDELNIIQQEPSDSGGGVGGSAKKAAKEYKNMFRQVKSFDEGVKRVVDFIEDHLGGIWGLIAKIGAAILGWKISKAFDGVLGRIGKLIAGGALLVLGVELSYGAGYEAGKKGYFDGADILTTLGGWLASALGGYLIGTAIAGPAGGVYGAIIGLAIGIEATLFGWLIGTEEAKQDAMWGNLKMTREEIENYVKGQFDFDVVAEIEVIKAQVTKQAEARRNVRIAFNQFRTSLGQLKVGIEVGIDAKNMNLLVTNAYADYQTFCTNLQGMIDDKNEGVKLLLTTFSFKDSNGNVLTDDIVKNLSIADTNIMEYFMGLGEQIAYWIDQGEQSGWTKNEANMVLSLMERQRNIVQKAEEARGRQDKETKIRTGLYGVIDRQTAKDTIEVQKGYLREWETEAKALVDAQISDAAYMKELATQAYADALANGADQATLDKIEQSMNYYDYWLSLLDNPDMYESEIRNRLEPTKKVMAKEWANTLRTVFGEKIDAELPTHFFDKDFAKKFENVYSANGVEGASKSIRNQVLNVLKRVDKDGIIKDAVEVLGMDLWSVIGDDARNEILDIVAELVAPEDIDEVLRTAFGVADDEIEDYANLARSRKTMKDTAAELGNYFETSDFVHDMEQQAYDLENVKNRLGKFANYGSDVLEMGSYKGFTNVDSFRDWKRNGMPGMEELLRPEAIEYDLEVVTDSSMSEPIDAPAIDQTNFVSSLESMYETTRRYVLGIIRMLNSISGVDTSAYRSLTAGINKIHMQGFASGGFVNSGDIVMANENGNFEMMGRMGNQPVVANNQQIVAGISQGVSTANGEVVAAINNLINVVQRQGNRPVQVNIGSSARLGQTCERSIDMWNKQNGR